MIRDPCWLPSAIMQTTGALLGLYLIVHVYASQRIKDAVAQQESESLSRNVRTMLSHIIYILVPVGMITVIVNTLWLDRLIKNSNMIFPKLNYFSIFLFFLTISCILVYSLVLVRVMDVWETKVKESIRKSSEEKKE